MGLHLEVGYKVPPPLGLQHLGKALQHIRAMLRFLSERRCILCLGTPGNGACAELCMCSGWGETSDPAASLSFVTACTGQSNATSSGRLSASRAGCSLGWRTQGTRRTGAVPWEKENWRGDKRGKAPRSASTTLLRLPSLSPRETKWFSVVLAFPRVLLAIFMTE